MSSQNILDSYLIRLGAEIDTASVSRFKTTLADISGLVDNTYLDMAKKFVEFQVGVTSGFAAIGIAALGIADKTAMADQNYRLLALHLYTSIPIARELKMALDALGQPLENVLWDPELAGRFHQLVQDQQKMTENLGPDFENQMMKIRDVRFEFSRFGVELQYLTMYVVEDLAKAFGTNIDGVLGKMRNFNDWLIANMPAIADWISSKLKPILIDVYQVLEGTWELLKQIGGQLKGIDWIAVIGDIGKAVVEVTKLEQGLLPVLGAADAIRRGNFSEAYKDIKQAGGDVQSAAGSQIFTLVPGGVTDRILGLFGAGATRLPVDSVAGIQAQIIAVAKKLGVPPELALAVAAQESGFKEFNSSGGVLTNPKSGARGLMQLLPSTAKSLGVNPDDTYGNIFGGVALLHQLLGQYKDPAQALSHYGGRGGPESQQYARDVMARESNFNITVNVSGNQDAKQIGSEVAKAVKDAQDQRVQRNLAELNNMGYSY